MHMHPCKRFVQASASRPMQFLCRNAFLPHPADRARRSTPCSWHKEYDAWHGELMHARRFQQVQRAVGTPSSSCSLCIAGVHTHMYMFVSHLSVCMQRAAAATGVMLQHDQGQAGQRTCWHMLAVGCAAWPTGGGNSHALLAPCMRARASHVYRGSLLTTGRQSKHVLVFVFAAPPSNGSCGRASPGNARFKHVHTSASRVP